MVRAESKESLLVLEVARECLEESTLSEWSRFMEDHESSFGSDEEHRFEYTEIHGKFLEVVERRISSCLERNESSVRDFYAACRGLRKQSDGTVETFVDLMLLATDYAAFVDLMTSRERRTYCLELLRAWRRELLLGGPNKK